MVLITTIKQKNLFYYFENRVAKIEKNNKQRRIANSHITPVISFARTFLRAPTVRGHRNKKPVKLNNFKS